MCALIQIEDKVRQEGILSYEDRLLKQETALKPTRLTEFESYASIIFIVVFILWSMDCKPVNIMLIVIAVALSYAVGILIEIKNKLK